MSAIGIYEDQPQPWDYSWILDSDILKSNGPSRENRYTTHFCVSQSFSTTYIFTLQYEV